MYTKEIIHFPNLKTVLIVENVLKEANCYSQEKILKREFEEINSIIALIQKHKHYFSLCRKVF